MSDRLNAYYARTIDQYETLREHNTEHMAAVRTAVDLLFDRSWTSVLDVGCGTGQSLKWFAETHPRVKLHGVDPSPDMVQRARAALPGASLDVGSGDRLNYADRSVDLVLASGVMHHVEDTEALIAEMFRVARVAVLISDHNNYAFGRPFMRRLRLGLFAAGLHRAFYFVRNGFHRQGYSEEDGWWFQYSILDDYRAVSSRSAQVLIIPTLAPSDVSDNLVTCQTHLAFLGLLPDEGPSQPPGYIM